MIYQFTNKSKHYLKVTKEFKDKLYLFPNQFNKEIKYPKKQFNRDDFFEKIIKIRFYWIFYKFELLLRYT
jgi:hypothetical protein